jgi:inorganic pyrophosphatase
VPKGKRRTAGLASPLSLGSFDPDDADLLVVVIETPKGSRNKYAFDPEERIFALSKVLPAGMEFPYDFGFIPSTKAGDGDPLDALVLMDEPAFPGCRLACRPIGIIEGEQVDKKETRRNDRVVCVERGTHSYTHIRHIDDLGKAFEKELENFFVNYHEFVGKNFRVLGIKGPAQARRQVTACRKSARHHAQA